MRRYTLLIDIGECVFHILIPILALFIVSAQMLSVSGLTDALIASLMTKSKTVNVSDARVTVGRRYKMSSIT